jgi:hypothetical protein
MIRRDSKRGLGNSLSYPTSSTLERPMVCRTKIYFQVAPVPIWNCRMARSSMVNRDKSNLNNFKLSKTNNIPLACLVMNCGYLHQQILQI